jgi:hypothetical protein
MDVERQNLTIRMMCRRFTPLTNASSKKLATLMAALALHFACYKFRRKHATLRVTPAMTAGVGDRVWGIGEYLTYAALGWEPMPSRKRERYTRQPTIRAAIQ